MRVASIGLILFFMLIILLSTAAEIPPFGNSMNPPHNYISHHYLTESAHETGAVNVVTGIILDYRAFDTLGEATVIFVAVIAVISVLWKGGSTHDRG